MPFDLKAARLRAGLSQQDLARLSRVSLRQVKAIESGQTTSPYPHTVSALRSVLHPESKSPEATYGLAQLLAYRALESHCEQYGEWAPSLIRLAPDYEAIYRSNGKFACELVEDFIEARQGAAQSGCEPYVTAPEVWDSLLAMTATRLATLGLPTTVIAGQELSVATAQGPLTLVTTTGDDIEASLLGRRWLWDLTTLESHEYLADLIAGHVAHIPAPSA